MGLEVGSFLKSAPHGGRKTIHETPFHRLAGKIARTPVAQRKTAVLGWLAGQGNDRAYLLGRDPIRPAATRRITQTVRHRPANTGAGKPSRPPSAHRLAPNPQPVRRSLNPKAFTQKQYDASPHRKLLRRQRRSDKALKPIAVLLHSIQSWLPLRSHLVPPS